MSSSSQPAGQRTASLSRLPASSGNVHENKTLDQILLEAIQSALAANNGNQTATAKQLGISRSTMWRHMQAAEKNSINRK